MLFRFETDWSRFCCCLFLFLININTDEHCALFNIKKAIPYSNCDSKIRNENMLIFNSTHTRR